jgi:hypothetical protein
MRQFSNYREFKSLVRAAYPLARSWDDEGENGKAAPDRRNVSV